MTAAAQAFDLLSPLRPYQLEAARAIVDSVEKRRGLSISVEISRQGGKNELSARVELLLLLLNARRSVTNIKVAPTMKPQAGVSRDRLWGLIQQLGLEPLCRREGSVISVGRARQVFLSAERNSNIVGHTANLLLEVDEAQDVDIEKFDKELRPMAASTNATTVFYGTAWDDANLLERARQTHLAATAADGMQRHFEYDWQVVGASLPEYAAFVRRERERLGADHPSFTTQYCLQPVPGRGRLLNATQLALLRGGHDRLPAPRQGDVYVAGLDIAGAADEGRAEAHDLNVLTIGRLVPASAEDAGATVEVVQHLAWQGAPHDVLYGALVSQLRDVWKVAHVSVDASGLGESLAAFLAKSLGRGRVKAQKLTSDSKSHLGYNLLAAVNGGRVRLYRDESPELRECLRQLALCRAEYRSGRTLNYYVEPRDGHDDYVISLALLAGTLESASPRRARGRLEHREERQW